MKPFRSARALFLLTGILLALCSPSAANAQTPCGQWTFDSNQQDKRLDVQHVVSSSTGNCSNIFRFSNKSPVVFGLLGGYTFKLKALSSGAQVSWLPSVNFGNEIYLIPGIDEELTTTPLNPTLSSDTIVGGAMTLDSFTIDSTIFLIYRVLPGGCVIPKKELPGVVLRTSTILLNTVARAAQWDTEGAIQELLQVQEEFINQLKSALVDIGIDCGLNRIAGELMAKKLTLAIDYATWVPVVIADNLRYWGSNSVTTLTYTAASNPSPTPFNGAPTQTPPPIVFGCSGFGRCATPTPFVVPTSKPAPTVTPNVSRPSIAGQIVFQVNFNQAGQIYLMNADGTNKHKLTDDPFYNLSPQWSPDGRRIVFVANPNDHYQVYTMNADGTGRRQLTNDSADYLDPSWSPDGRFIAAMVIRDSKRDMYVMNSDGTNQRRLTNSPGPLSHPRWSPDGRLIAYTSYRNGNYDIFVMNSDGTNQHGLTSNAADDDTPSWSPDSQLIAFSSNRDDPAPRLCGQACQRQIYIMIADGTNQRRLTSSRGEKFDPTWSPDGRLIAFTSVVDLHGVIEIVNADGSNERTLADLGVTSDSERPAWSPK